MVRLRRAAAVLLAAGLLSVWSSAIAETPEEAFARGNAAYEAGDFAQAAEAYESILRYGVIRDPRVEYNLGNAQFKRGRLGSAILHYLRAQRLDPTDEDIRSNLAYARSLTVDQIPEPRSAAVIDWLRYQQNRLGPDRQAWALLALVWIAAGLISWGLSARGRWNAACGWSLAALVLAISLTAGSWYATWHRLEGRRLAVILGASVEVLAGPGANNATLFTVHEGLTVEVRSDERGEWLQVSLPNGLSGWLPVYAVGIV